MHICWEENAFVIGVTKTPVILLSSQHRDCWGFFLPCCLISRDRNQISLSLTDKEVTEEAWAGFCSSASFLQSVFFYLSFILSRKKNSMMCKCRWDTLLLNCCRHLCFMLLSCFLVSFYLSAVTPCTSCIAFMLLIFGALQEVLSHCESVACVWLYRQYLLLFNDNVYVLL